MSSSCQETISEYFAAIRALDTDRFVNVFAPDATTHDPVGAPPFTGHAAIRGFFEGIKAACETLNLTEQGVFLRGNAAAVKWSGNGRSRSGNNFTFEGVDVIDCNDAGKIVQVRAFYDPAPLMAAIQG